MLQGQRKTWLDSDLESLTKSLIQLNIQEPKKPHVVSLYLSIFH